MKRLSTLFTLMTALVAIAAAASQPDEQAQLASASIDIVQTWGSAADAPGGRVDGMRSH